MTKEETLSQNVIQWVVDAYRYGYSSERITQELLSHGWPEQEIDRLVDTYSEERKIKTSEWSVRILGAAGLLLLSYLVDYFIRAWFYAFESQTEPGPYEIVGVNSYDHVVNYSLFFFGTLLVALISAVAFDVLTNKTRRTSFSIISILIVVPALIFGLIFYFNTKDSIDAFSGASVLGKYTFFAIPLFAGFIMQRIYVMIKKSSLNSRLEKISANNKELVRVFVMDEIIEKTAQSSPFKQSPRAARVYSWLSLAVIIAVSIVNIFFLLYLFIFR